MARPAILHVDEAGFSISGVSNVGHIPWESVLQAAAYKRDLYTVDQVCVALEYGAPPSAIELNEAMENFTGFCEAFAASLPGATPFASWYLYVAFPAFETNLLTIYRRDGEADAVPEAPAVVGTPDGTAPVTRWGRVASATTRVIDALFLPLDLFARGVQYVVLSPVFLLLYILRCRSGTRSPGGSPNA